MDTKRHLGRWKVMQPWEMKGPNKNENELVTFEKQLALGNRKTSPNHQQQGFNRVNFIGVSEGSNMSGSVWGFVCACGVIIMLRSHNYMPLKVSPAILSCRLFMLLWAFTIVFIFLSAKGSVHLKLSILFCVLLQKKIGTIIFCVVLVTILVVILGVVFGFIDVDGDDS